MKNEQDNKVEMAKEVGKLLPESINKVEYYRDILQAESNLLDILEKRQKSKFVFEVTKSREKIEMVQIKNGIIQKKKIYEAYLSRKKKYEHWLDEMSVEVQSNFENVIAEAKQISANLRLVGSIQSYESMKKERMMTMQEKVEFYLYLKQEISNFKKFGKKK
jgi:hypothetical protein